MVDILDRVGPILQRKLSGIQSGLFVYMVSAAVFPLTGAGGRVSIAWPTRPEILPFTETNLPPTRQDRSIVPGTELQGTALEE